MTGYLGHHREIIYVYTGPQYGRVQAVKHDLEERVFACLLTISEPLGHVAVGRLNV